MTTLSPQIARPLVQVHPHQILIVDDEPELLEILLEWFSAQGYRVQTAPNGFEALALAKRYPFDIIITDLKMPGLNGLQLLAMFKELLPVAEVIFLTGQGTMEDAIAALREGRAFDFLQKPIKNLRQLNQVVEKALARKLLREGPSGPSGQSGLPAHLEPLSPRELEIMAFLAQGLENAEIAERLRVSEKTVKNHLTRIYEKLQVKNRTQAVLLCQRYGMT
jgi:DNA-binding NarL/FixJ family response regulator